MAKVNLTKPIRQELFKTSKANGGLKASSEESPVIRDGGDEGAGILKAAAVITRGEALGHGFWVDTFMVGQVAAALVASEQRGTKSRFTHPGLSEDGLGKRLGKVKGGFQDGDIARGDIHLARAAHKAPGGNLAEYVMDLAEEDPESFGTSIAFEIDWDATFEHWKANGGTEDEGVMIDHLYGYIDEGFQSDDELNVQNLLHVRLKELRAVDVVDDPAANPGGLFHSNQIPVEADQLLSFALGLSIERPQSSLFNVEPGRVAGFVSKFLQSHNLQIITKGDSGMSKKALNDNPQDTKPESTETPKPEAKPAAEPTAKTDEAKPVAETSTADDDDSSDDEADTKPAGEQTPEQLATAKLSKYVKAFGADNAAKWFGEGKTFEECLQLHNDQLKGELAAANTKLLSAKANLGEAEPAAFGTPEASQSNLTGINKFAANIKIPGRK